MTQIKLSKKEQQMMQQYQAKQQAKAQSVGASHRGTMVFYDEIDGSWGSSVGHSGGAGSAAKSMTQAEMQAKMDMAEQNRKHAESMAMYHMSEQMNTQKKVVALEHQLETLQKNMAEKVEECRQLREQMVKMRDHVEGLEAALKIIGNEKA